MYLESVTDGVLKFDRALTVAEYGADTIVDIGKVVKFDDPSVTTIEFVANPDILTELTINISSSSL